MIPAAFLNDIHLSETRKEIRRVFLFEVEEQLIIAVGEELMRINDINYVCLWLLSKRVEEVYGDHFTVADKKILRKAGINVRPIAEVSSHPVLKAMLLKYGY